MNHFQVGNMITKYIESFKANLDECLIFKSIIEYKFEKFTRPYIRNQMVFYAICFLTPYLMVLFGQHLQGVSLKFCLSTSLIGALGMFFFEWMDIVVNGASVYFKDWWNWIDVMTLIIYVAFYSISMF